MKMTEIKLNIGCGPYKEEGYINIDKNPIWEPDKILDVRNGLPFEDNSLSEVRAWHFIEHLSKDEIISFLALVYKKLKKGGRLDLLFPTGVTYDLDHKSFLERESFILFTRGGKDDWYYGKEIALKLIAESRSEDKNCKMLRMLFEVRK